MTQPGLLGCASPMCCLMNTEQERKRWRFLSMGRNDHRLRSWGLVRKQSRTGRHVMARDEEAQERVVCAHMMARLLLTSR